MSILNRARARHAKKHKPRYTYCWQTRQWYLKGGERPQPPAPNPEPQPAPEPTALPVEDSVHTEGETCPHCGGSGRYLIYTAQKRLWGKCFRCDGKGTLDVKDLAFYHRRVEQGLPLNRIFGGAVAA